MRENKIHSALLNLYELFFNFYFPYFLIFIFILAYLFLFFPQETGTHLTFFEKNKIKINSRENYKNQQYKNQLIFLLFMSLFHFFKKS